MQLYSISINDYDIIDENFAFCEHEANFLSIICEVIVKLKKKPQQTSLVFMLLKQYIQRIFKFNVFIDSSHSWLDPTSLR